MPAWTQAASVHSRASGRYVLVSWLDPQFLPYSEDEPIMLGAVLLFFGGGMLTYYLIAARRLAGRAGMQ